MNKMTELKLVEPGTKYFFSETLRRCKQSKYDYYSYLYNFILFILFFGILGIILYYNYKQKNSEESKKEQELKNANKQRYIMDLTNKLKEENMKKIKDNNMITDLPNFESEFEITMKKFL